MSRVLIKLGFEFGFEFGFERSFHIHSSRRLYLEELFAGEDVLSQGGLKVHTTLDLALQEKAEQLVLEDGLSMLGGEDKGEAALVAIDPAQGAVRVLIGGREYANSPFNRAVLSRRAAGSAFKPFVYLAALAEVGSGGTRFEIEMVGRPVALKGRPVSPYSHTRVVYN